MIVRRPASLIPLVTLLVVLCGCGPTEPPLDDPPAMDPSTGAATVVTDPCLGGPVVPDQQLDERVGLSAPAFPGLVLTFGTKKASYEMNDPCMPVYLEVTNPGADPVALSAQQATALSALTVGLYSSSFLFSEPLSLPSGTAVSEGAVLGPGERFVLGAALGRERTTLYSIPPAGGGVVDRSLDVQGPFGAYGSIGPARLDLTFPVDFGILPFTRVPDPGAGISFVEGEVLVRFAATVSRAEAEGLVIQHGCHIREVVVSQNLFRLSIPFDRTTGEMIAAFGAEPQVLYAERNGIITVFTP